MRKTTEKIGAYPYVATLIAFYIILTLSTRSFHISHQKSSDEYLAFRTCLHEPRLAVNPNQPVCQSTPVNVNTIAG